MSQGLLYCQEYAAAAIVGGLHYRGQCVAHVCAPMSFFVWQPPISRGTKTTRWPSEPVEENMTSDLTAFSLMAHGNGLKFMTRAKIQVSKLRYLLRLFYSVFIHEFIQNLNISYFLEGIKSINSGQTQYRPFTGFWVLVLTLEKLKVHKIHMTNIGDLHTWALSNTPKTTPS